MKPFEEYTVANLRNELKLKGLKTNGNKRVLYDRLKMAVSLEINDDISFISNGEKNEESNVLDQNRGYDSSYHEINVNSNAGVLRKTSLEREIDLLKRERDLLERENSLMLAERRAGHEQRISPASLSDLLNKFDGENFNIWKTQISNIQQVYKIPDNEMKLIVISKLNGKALQWFHSKPGNINLKLVELLQELKIMFDTRISRLQLRKQLESRKWKSHEPFSEYFHEKLLLINKLNIPDDELVDYIIDGIPDTTLQNQARIQQYSSVEQLLQSFNQLTLSDKGQRNAYGQSVAASSKKPPEKFIDTICYNCGQKGHLSLQCNKPKRQYGTCFSCGSSEHKIKECPKSKSTRQHEISVINTEETINKVREIKLNDYFCNVKILIEDSSKKCNWKECNSLIDTGSGVNLIKEKFVDKSNIDKFDDSTKYYGINNSELRAIGCINSMIDIKNEIYKIDLLVVPNDTMSNDIILGRKFWQNLNVKLIIDVKSEQDSEDNILNINIDSKTDLEFNVNNDLNLEVKNYVQNSFENYNNVLKQNDRAKTKYEMVIKLDKEDYFHCSPRRLSFIEREKLLKILNELIEKEIIRPSISPYCSPIVLVKKKNNFDYRLCVDFRTLNKQTRRDNYPLPVVEDLIDKLGGKRFFTSLDLKSGFHQISVEENSIPYTSFTTPFGQFEYMKMPFGLRNAPSVFQRFVELIFRNLIIESKIVVYLDDILIATYSLEEHLKILDEVLNVLADNLLELNMSKCKFLYKEIDFLGYHVNFEGVRPNASNLRAIEDFAVPKNIRELQRFLGLCSYFRKFVSGFTLIAKPLQDLLKGNVKFEFGPEELKSYETLKQKLLESPVLSIYSTSDITELHCDGSSIGYGAILLQKKSDGRFHPIFYFSKRTTTQESKYHSYELETLAIIYALRRFRIYLLGRPFKIVTDCNALTLTLNKQIINPRIARWALEMQNYDYSVEHRDGKRMQHVDALSRCNSILILEESPFEQRMAICQSQDKELEKLREKLEKNEHPFFELRDGLIYRKINKKKIRFYLPEVMIPHVLKISHDSLGHLGVEKTAEVISRTYWFPKLKDRIKDYIKYCPKCITFNPPSGKIEGYLHPIPKGDKPFLTIHADYYGPLEPGKYKRKYILVVIDAFTKLVKLFPTKTTSSEETISCLTSYFSQFSRPLRLVTDRGSCFTSELFKSFVQTHSLQHILTASGCPKANGQVERFNRTIAPMIAKLVDPINRVTWDKVLPEIEFALNNTINKSTNATPSMLLYGVNQRGNVNDNVKEYLENEVLEDELLDLSHIRTNACENIVKSQNYAERKYNQTKKEAQRYSIGDLVMITNIDTTVGVSKKLIPKYRGPYIVTKVLDNDRYLLKDVPGFQITQRPFEGIYDVSRMKRWFYQSGNTSKQD